MRTKLSVIAAVAALVFAGTAKADTISLIWQGGGTASTLTSPSSTITADIVVTITSTNITAIGWNIAWDNDLGYVTTSCGLVGAPADWSVGFCSPGFPAGGSPGRVQNPAGAGNQGAYKLNDTGSADLTPGTATVGTITFHVTASLANDGIDVNTTFTDTSDGVGCFTTGTTFCTGGLTLTGAAANVPEPGTVALMGLGLAGLGLVGRRSRS